MKVKFGMWALCLLFVMALAGTVFVPVVSADENEILIDTNELGAVDEEYLSVVALMKMLILHH